MAALQPLKAISPKSYDVSFFHIFARHVASPPLASVQPEFGARVDYDARVLYWLSEWAYEQDPPTEIRLGKRMCQLDAGWCARLGADCVDQRDEACAVAAFERALAEGPDRVSVSQNCRWIMKYYLRRQREAEARAVAEMAAETGSSGGLSTMASFLEETGEYAEAEKYILQKQERYPRKEPNYELIGFYQRVARARGASAYGLKFTEATKNIFPGGPEKVELASFGAAPTDGVVFTTESPSLRRNGMHRGDIVVAMDGWRVRNYEQFATIREFDDDPDLRLVLWRGGKYLAVSARRLGRRFGVDVPSYQPSNK